MQVGAAAHVKSKFLPFRLKTEGLAYIGFVWQ
jgi:hypothetical protein